MFRMLSLPPLLAYPAVGILIGPHALGLVPDSSQTRYLAEFGVFLMFSISLSSVAAAQNRCVRTCSGSVVPGRADHAPLAAGALISRYFGVGRRCIRTRCALTMCRPRS
jgi:Kef-type K+ transport system membrane component KefB